MSEAEALAVVARAGSGTSGLFPQIVTWPPINSLTSHLNLNSIEMFIE